MKTIHSVVALVIGTLIGPVAGTGCNRSSARTVPEAPPPAPVTVVHPKQGSITRSITLPGQIKAFQQATLYAKVGGYLKSIAVDKGDRVERGSLLAEIEVPELLADRARNHAEVEVAELDYRRLSDSQKKAPDLVTPQAVDDARGKLDVARANLERTETLLNFARITAPFAGIVTRRLVDPGAFIPAATAGSTPLNAALLTIADFNTVRVQVAVPESESELVASGKPVQVTVEGLPGRTFDGSITRFAYALDDVSKTMLAEIELPNPQLELRPGMYASVQIGIERKDGALLVPADAVLTEKSGASVFVLDGKTARKTRVRTGFNDGKEIEVVSGLNPDQAVIVVGKQPLNDGQPVSIAQAR